MLRMLSSSVRPECSGVPEVTAASVPRLASLAHASNAPIVPSGLTITHRPPNIITAISAVSPSVCDTRRRTIPW